MNADPQPTSQFGAAFGSQNATMAASDQVQQSVKSEVDKTAATNQDLPNMKNKSASEGQPLKKKSTAKLENYQIMQNIGEGAFGQVNLAVDKSTNKYVAIKAVNILKTCQMNKERHVLRERDLLLSLNHPNIIRMHSCFKVSIENHYLGEIH